MVVILFIVIVISNVVANPKIDYKPKETYVYVEGRMKLFDGGGSIVIVDKSSGGVYKDDTNNIRISETVLNFTETNTDFWPNFLKAIGNLKVEPAEKSYHRCLCHCPQYEFDLHYLPKEYLKTVRFEKCGEQIILNIKEGEKYSEIELKGELKNEFLKYFQRIKDKLSKDVLTR